MMNLVSLDESVPDNILCLDFSLNSGVPFNFVIHTCTWMHDNKIDDESIIEMIDKASLEFRYIWTKAELRINWCYFVTN